MGTEFINQAPVKRVEIYKYNEQIYAGPGDLSLKRGAYKYGNAFINFGSKAGFNAFAYLSLEEFKVLRDQIDSLIEGGNPPPIEGWSDEGDDEITPKEALAILESERGGTVWLKDWSETNYGTEENPSYDYPIEDPDELKDLIDEGEFEGDDPVIILRDKYA